MRSVIAPTISPSTSSAPSSAVFADDQIISLEGVASSAMRPTSTRYPGVAPHQVFSGKNRLHVVGVYTTSIPAEMVYPMSFWDWPYQGFPNHPMSQLFSSWGASGEVESPIPVLSLAGQPFPAITGSINLGPKPLVHGSIVTEWS